MLRRARSHFTAVSNHEQSGTGWLIGEARRTGGEIEPSPYLSHLTEFGQRDLEAAREHVSHQPTNTRTLE